MKWYRQRRKPSIPVYQLPFPLLLISHVWLFVTPWTAARHASLSSTISQSLLKFMSVELLMPSNYFILYRPLLLPSIFPSIKVFYKESAFRIRWPKYWSFNFSISPSNEYSWLISFRRASLLTQMIKNSPPMQETHIQEYPLDKRRATHSSILAWRIPWSEKPGGLQSMGSQRIGNNWVNFTFPLGLTDLIFLQSKGFSSLLQNHSSKASIFWRSAFFMVQLTHLYVTIEKTLGLTVDLY